MVMNEITGSAERRARQFTELFGTYYSPVLAYARRRVGADIAQDVVAETFLAAWNNLDELPPDLRQAARSHHPWPDPRQRRQQANLVPFLTITTRAAGPVPSSPHAGQGPADDPAAARRQGAPQAASAC
jgi:hypothetical protein